MKSEVPLAKNCQKWRGKKDEFVKRLKRDFFVLSKNNTLIAYFDILLTLFPLFSWLVVVLAAKNGSSGTDFVSYV